MDFDSSGLFRALVAIRLDIKACGPILSTHLNVTRTVFRILILVAVRARGIVRHRTGVCQHLDQLEVGFLEELRLWSWS